MEYLFDLYKKMLYFSGNMYFPLLGEKICYFISDNCIQFRSGSAVLTFNHIGQSVIQQHWPVRYTDDRRYWKKGMPYDIGRSDI